MAPILAVAGSTPADLTINNIKNMTTPKEIKSLKPNEVFVFGSNLNGNHYGGAAKQALDMFGAVEGQGEGLMGQSYAFPTLNKKMKKVSKKELKESVNKLYQCATDNKDKTFFVTKVGCGIAGFTEEEIKPLFTGNPKNVILPKKWSIIKGYKAFNVGLKCRDFQYELGKDFYHKGDIELCSQGFHFCKSLSDVYSYYQYGTDIVVGEIESEGDVIDENDGNKSVTNHIRIIRILNAEESANNNGANNVGHSNTGDNNTGDRNTGDRNTGDRNTGNRNIGNWNTGNRNTGDNNTGDNNTGDRNTGHWNTGDRNTGNRNIGYSNTGDSNTGDWNTGDRNTGSFNTITPKEVLVFNKLCKKEEWDSVEKPSCLFFSVNKLVPFEEMTDSEKETYGTSKYTGGYMKKLDYKEAFTESLKNASEEEIKQIKKLPNFDADIFEEISGFRIK